VTAGVLPRRSRSGSVGRWIGLGLAAGLAILLVAGIVHIVTIFLVPKYVPADGWTRLADQSSTDRFTILEDQERNRPVVPGLDPLFVHASCRLDLSEAPAQLTLIAPDRFWSLALFDPRGVIVFSLNDRTALGGELHMLVATPAQHAQLREHPPQGIEETIVVQSEATDLIALVRLYAPSEGARQAARQIGAAASCPAFPLTVD
jgi:uncharacterized membrane protein